MDCAEVRVRAREACTSRDQRWARPGTEIEHLRPGTCTFEIGPSKFARARAKTLEELTGAAGATYFEYDTNK